MTERPTTGSGDPASTAVELRGASRTLRIWSATWAAGGALAGTVLALAEPGHVPRPLLPLLLALVGAISGLAAGALGRLLRRLTGASGPGAYAIAAGCGALAGLALWRFGLGTPPLPSLAAGVALAVLAHAIEARPAGGAR